MTRFPYSRTMMRSAVAAAVIGSAAAFAPAALPTFGRSATSECLRWGPVLHALLASVQPAALGAPDVAFTIRAALARRAQRAVS